MTELLAPAKLNLALVVGPKRTDGKHELSTVLQRIALADTVRLEPAEELGVHGFADDTLVRRALELEAAHAGAEPRTKAYGAVSVLIQLAAVRTGTHPVSREVFRPRPNVDLSLIHI